MSGYKNVSRKILVIAIIAVIAVFGVTGALAAYWHAESQANTEQPTPTPVPGTPKLESANLRYVDNRTDPDAPYVEVTGTVTNTGDHTANNCAVHLVATRGSDETVIDAKQPFDPLEPGETREVNVKFTYTGDALLACTATLDWTN